MARQQTAESNASTDQADSSGSSQKRSVSIGVTIGKIAEKLVELDAEEAAALASAPQRIKDEFTKKRADATEKLTKEQKKAAVDLAKVLSPKAAE